MDIVRALVLGIVQGLTEFIPVSSSGHLVLVPHAFGWPDQGLAFDAALHVGTLLAVLAYFRRDWLTLARSGLNDLREHGARFPAYGNDSRLLLSIALATLPAVVAGLALDDWIEGHLREVWTVATALVVAGVFMLVAERTARLSRTASSLRIVEAVAIGLAQACALFPGVSRSGATIATGLVLGLRREEAARFAFLLGTPAFAGAALLKSSDLLNAPRQELLDVCVGMATSAVVGFLAIAWLLRFLRGHSLIWFVGYRFALGFGALVLVAARAV